MKLFDGCNLVDIRILRNGIDFSADYFGLYKTYPGYDDVYVVDDVEYCIDIACSRNPDEGACFVFGDDGEPHFDPDIIVCIERLALGTVGILGVTVPSDTEH